MSARRRLRSGDPVIIIAGNDKGKTGKILAFRKDRVVVEGVNIRKKHMRKSQENQKGQIIEIECPVHISTIKPYLENKAVKLRARFNDKKQKELYHLDGKKEVSYRLSKNK